MDSLKARVSTKAALIVIVLVLASVAGAVLARAIEKQRDLDRVWRVGVNNSPPYSILSADGSIAGFGFELLNAAAVHGHVRLKWVAAPEGPDAAFKTGKVDLWPLVTVTPARLKNLHFTAPVLSIRRLVVTRKGANLQTPGGLAGKRIASIQVPFATDLARRMFPGSKLVPSPTWDLVLQSLCRGESDAAAMDQRALYSVLLKRPEDCQGLDFETIPLTGENLLAIAAMRNEAARIADLLREQVVNLAEQGTLPIYGRWLMSGTDETRALDEAIKNRREMRLLWTGLAAITFLLLFAIWQNRRARIAQRASVAASVEAQKANRAKSIFLANMSHELRTPLHGVLGTVDLLSQTNLDEEQREYTEIVTTSAQCLQQLIDGVLDYSKIEAGKLEIEVDRFSLRRGVSDALEIVRAQARHKHLDLALDWGPGVPEEILGDEARTRQVLLNLLSNAVKFTAVGSVKVRCEVLPDEIAPYLRFQVEDTGIGIAPEILPALFQPFSQGDSGTTKKFGGTGLGLAISKRLVELMGGTIGVESKPGQGSRFWFTLPLRPAGVEAPMRAATMAGSPSPCTGSF